MLNYVSSTDYDIHCFYTHCLTGVALLAMGNISCAYRAKSFYNGA